MHSSLKAFALSDWSMTPKTKCWQWTQCRKNTHFHWSQQGFSQQQGVACMELILGSGPVCVRAVVRILGPQIIPFWKEKYLSLYQRQMWLLQENHDFSNIILCFSVRWIHIACFPDGSWEAWERAIVKRTSFSFMTDIRQENYILNISDLITKQKTLVQSRA